MAANLELTCGIVSRPSAGECGGRDVIGDRTAPGYPEACIRQLDFAAAGYLSVNSFNSRSFEKDLELILAR
jgi:hypothetical protein